MYTRIIGGILAGIVVAAIIGYHISHIPESEPWDDTGYFKQDRTHFEPLQEQLRQRLAHTQNRL